MASTLIGKQAVVIGAGWADSRPRGHSPIVSSRFRSGARHSALGARVPRGDAAGAARACAAAQRPVRSRRVVPGFEQDLARAGALLLREPFGLPVLLLEISGRRRVA